MRLISVLGAGMVFGIGLWLLIFLLSFLVFRFFLFGGGFVSIFPWDARIFEYIKAALIVGIIHGFLVALGMLFSARYNSFLANAFFGIITTEFGVAVVQFYVFSFLFSAWKSTTSFNSILSAAYWYLLFTAVLLLPTLALVLMVSKLLKIGTFATDTQ